MARFCLTLVTLLGTALAQVQGQDSDSRYVPIPFQGNFEALFKVRLQGAKELDSLQALLKQHNIDADLLKKFKLDDPAIAKKLSGLIAKHELAKQLSPAELSKITKNLEALSQPRPTLPSLPKEAGALPLPRAVKRARPPRDLMKEWLRELAHETEELELADWLRDSPAFQKGLLDLKTLGDFDRGLSDWSLDLPKHLRFTDKVRISLGDGFLDRLKNISLPDVPQVNLPHINLGRWNVPAVPLPNIGGPGRFQAGEALLWLVVIVGGIVLAWQIAKNLKPRRHTRDVRILLGPWPVDPAQVATRSQLIQAFDYLAILLLGTVVRTWNHRAIARKLTAATQLPQASEELALLYERARYTSGPDLLSIHDQSAVRRDLCLLAGVARA